MDLAAKGTITVIEVLWFEMMLSQFASLLFYGTNLKRTN